MSYTKKEIESIKKLKKIVDEWFIQMEDQKKKNNESLKEFERIIDNIIEYH